MAMQQKNVWPEELNRNEAPTAQELYDEITRCEFERKSEEDNIWYYPSGHSHSGYGIELDFNGNKLGSGLTIIYFVFKAHKCQYCTRRFRSNNDKNGHEGRCLNNKK
eukprot:69659_1